jgi:nucleoside-diphosphate-sugar epimerase
MELAGPIGVTRPLVVVTGASGCVGRALVRRLVSDGATVRAISRSTAANGPGVIGFSADVRDDQALTSAFEGAEAIFHLAAYAHDVDSIDDSVHQQTVTLGGTLSALAAAERVGVKHFIFASSLAVFGPVPDGADEDAICKPQTPYGRAKFAAEQAVTEFAAKTGTFASCVRPAMIYGVGCRGNLPRMIRAVRARRFPPIPEFGNRRSMVSDMDVADVMVRAWRRNVTNGRPFIVTDGVGYSTRQIYEMILTAIGRGKPRFALPRPSFAVAARLGDVGGRVFGRRLPFDSVALDKLTGSAEFSSSRARTELGFTPVRTLSDVLPAMIRHLEAVRS